jgi:hypothetical protein
MTRITRTSTETIFKQSEAWFEAMLDLLLRDKTTK